MFKPQFAPLVETGSKRQTIRPVPEWRQPKPDEFESWRTWLGLPYRSKQRVLATVQLTDVRRIMISSVAVYVDHAKLTPSEVSALAAADGFGSAQEFQEWFAAHYDLPFHGILIRAKDAA